MATIRQNRLIPLLGVLVLLVIVFILFKTKDDTPSHKPMTSVPAPPTPSPGADTPADTIRALTAEVKVIKNDNQKLREDNSRLVQQNDDLNRNRAAIEENVTRRLTEQFARPEASGSPVFSGINRKIDELAATVQRYAPGAATGATVQAGGSDIPPGLGFDAAGAQATSPGLANAPGTAPVAAPAGPVPMVWWEPLGSRAVIGPDGQQKLMSAAQSAALPDATVPTHLAEESPVPAASPSTAPTSTAYFTIPENATLMDATAMTALIGRTPVGGNVRDPLEFKVLIGRTNLAANGLEVPDDVTGMVVSGVAVGDWMLSCVEGHINSITFVFQDGSINTVSRRASGGATGNNNAQRLGYVSDERGAPCINGAKITNAPAYLTQVVGIKSLEVAARAAAMSQTTTVANGLGSSTAVTGDQGKFVLGQAAASGVDEVSSWLMRRLNDSFDAVYVKPGARVAVHLTETIAIDKDPNARRLDHGHANRSGAARRTAHAQLD